MKKSGGFRKYSSTSVLDRYLSDDFSQSALRKKHKPSLKEGLLFIGLLLFTVLLLQHFNAGKNGITGAAHTVNSIVTSHEGVDIVTSHEGVDNGVWDTFTTALHDAFQEYHDSTENQQDKKNVVIATKNALDKLYK